MSGIGKRFIDAGYYHLKPLIPIGNSRLIYEVMSMFPGIEDPLFIVAKEHKQKGELVKYLKNNWPNSKISEIPAHKLGPGHAIYESKDFIDLNRPSIVSYCDFAGDWNFEDFCNELSKVDSLILTYTGFHPHMLRNTKYAYVKKDLDGFVTEIQEKNSFTDSPTSEEASAGLYAFASGTLLIESLEEQIKMNYSHFNEFYCSLTIKPLLDKSLKVKTFLMKKFMQFGTPEDLKDWTYIYKAVHDQNLKDLEQVSTKKEKSGHGTSIILAGGLGSRLSDFSQTPKPFLKIYDRELWQISNDAAEQANNKYIIIRKEFAPYLKGTSMVEPILLDKPTQGQADTARFALNVIKKTSEPITFMSCDNIINKEDYSRALKLLDDFDLIVWTAFGYPMSMYKPNRYSWVNLDSHRVTGFSLKSLPVAFKNPCVVIGNFTFRNSDLAQKLIEESFKSADRYSSEIYLDSVIQIALEFGYEVGSINSEKFFAIGTEEEVNTFNYYLDLEMSSKFNIWT